jgi:hypothetical protein
MDLQSDYKESKVSHMENNETFNQIVSGLAQELDNTVYTNLLDAGWSPDEAYKASFHSTWDLEDEAPVDDSVYDQEPTFDASVF